MGKGILKRAADFLWGSDGSKSAGGLLQGIMPSGQAPRRGTKEILQAYKRLPWVRAATFRIASDVAGVPLQLFSGKRGTSKALVDDIHHAQGVMKRDLLRKAIQRNELTQIEAHPFLDLVRSFNPALGAMATRQLMQMYQDLKGDGFLVKERNGAGLPLEMWPVPPHWIRETPSAASPTFKAAYATWTKDFPEQDVVWMRSVDPEMPYGRGAGIVEALSDECDIDELAARYIKNWFFNDASTPGIISVEGADEGDIDRLEARWDQKHRGVDRAHRLHFTNGKVNFASFAQSFKDQQLGQLRGTQRDTVIQVLGIPPECLGIIENSNRATIDSARYLYAIGVLCPRLDFQVASLQPVANEFDERLVVGYASPIPEDREFKRTVFQGAPWAFSKNETRALADEPPVDGGDEEFPPMPGTMPDLFGGGGEGEEEGDEKKRVLLVADPEWAKNLGQLRRPPRVVRIADAGDVENVLERLRAERLTDEVDPVWEERVRKWGNRVLNDLDVDVAFNMRNPLIREHLEKFSTLKIKGLVHDATRAELRQTLMEGVYAGEGIRDLEKRVTDVFDYADKVRARRIARTEVVGSSNFSNVQAYKQSGVVARKEWLAVRDSVTREEHRALEAQGAIGLDDPFRVDKYSGMHPGGFGAAEMDINCRCSVLPVVEAEGKAKSYAEEERAEMWKRFDKRLVPWERDAARALRRAFRKQEADILNALSR